MPRLVALAVPGGPRFVEVLRRVWDTGDAVFPLDLRLPPPERQRALEAMAPACLVDEHGNEHRLRGGRPVEPGDALVVATSGTTGVPKGAVLTHDAVRASALATTARLGVDPTTDRWLACLPLAHVGGLSVVTRALLTGTPVTVLPGFDPVAVEDAVRKGCTLVSLVATALRRVDPSRFRRIVLGGAVPPTELPTNVVTTYGMTETGSGVVYDGEPLAGVEVRVLIGTTGIGATDTGTTDTGTTGTGTTGIGEVWLRGPMLLRAYRDGHDPKDPDGWLPTGDLGEWTETGRLVVHGRRADVIVTGGEKVWPDPVEAVLRDAPGVADAAVGARPDPEWGQRVVAFVVPSNPAEPPTLHALRAVVKERLPAWAAPRELVVVRAIPRTALGKVQRAALP